MRTPAQYYEDTYPVCHSIVVVYIPSTSVPCVCVCVCVCLCLCVYLCVSECVYLLCECVCVHYTHTHTHTHHIMHHPSHTRIHKRIYECMYIYIYIYSKKMTGHTSCTDNNRTQRHQKSALLHTFFSLPKKKENPEASKIFVLCCKAKRAPCTVCPVFFFMPVYYYSLSLYSCCDMRVHRNLRRSSVKTKHLPPPLFF